MIDFLRLIAWYILQFFKRVVQFMVAIVFLIFIYAMIPGRDDTRTANFQGRFEDTPVSAVAFSPDGKSLAVAHYLNSVMEVLDLDKGTKRYSVDVTPGTIQIHFKDDGSISANNQSSVMHFDANGRFLVEHAPSNPATLWLSYFPKCGKFLYQSGPTNPVLLENETEPRNTVELANLLKEKRIRVRRILDDCRTVFCDVFGSERFNEDQFLYSMLFDIETGEIKQKFTDYSNGYVEKLSNNHFVSVKEEGVYIKIFDYQDHAVAWEFVRPIKEMNAFNGSRYEMLFSPGGEAHLIATGFMGYDTDDWLERHILRPTYGTIDVWNYKRKSKAYTMKFTKSPLAITFSADGKKLAIGFSDGSVAVWENPLELIRDTK